MLCCIFTSWHVIRCICKVRRIAIVLSLTATCMLLWTLVPFLIMTLQCWHCFHFMADTSGGQWKDSLYLVACSFMTSVPSLSAHFNHPSKISKVHSLFLKCLSNEGNLASLTKTESVCSSLWCALSQINACALLYVDFCAGSLTLSVPWMGCWRCREGFIKVHK